MLQHLLRVEGKKSLARVAGGFLLFNGFPRNRLLFIFLKSFTRIVKLYQ